MIEQKFELNVYIVMYIIIAGLLTVLSNVYLRFYHRSHPHKLLQIA